MKVIVDIYLVLEALNKSVKVFSQDITDEVNRSMCSDRPIYSVVDFDSLCKKLAEDFHYQWEIVNDLGGRTYARTRIRM